MQENNSNEGAGRIQTGAHQKSKPQDISHVDQQEGTMHNGELGGNLNEMRDKESGTSPNNERKEKEQA